MFFEKAVNGVQALRLAALALLPQACLAADAGGVLVLVGSFAAGGGFSLMPLSAAGHYTFGMLIFIFLARMLTTLLCFCSGALGGIFAPMLALGTLLGTAFGVGAMMLFPQNGLQAGTFATAGMGALFASSVRAPPTGIVLVLEITDLSTYPANDYHLSGRDAGGAVPGGQATLFLPVSAHLAASGAGKGCPASARCSKRDFPDTQYLNVNDA